MTSIPPKLISAWVPGRSVRELIEQHPDVFREARTVLISMLDSNENIHELPAVAELIRGDLRAEVLSSEPFVVTGRGLLRLLEERDLFTGFDEIWLLPHPVDTVPPPEASLVAPEQLDTVPPGPVATWMQESESLLGLGDGIGLNYVAADKGLLVQLGLVSSH
jgi:hypothetical protein